MSPDDVRFDTRGALRDAVVTVRRRARSAVPVRWVHRWTVNARILAWATVEAAGWVLLLPSVVLYVLACVAEFFFERVGQPLAEVLGMPLALAQERKWQASHAEWQRLVCDWVGRMASACPTVDSLRRGLSIGNGVSVQWSRGPYVSLMPGYHSAPLLDDDAFIAAAADAEASRIEHLENVGHTPHCVRRIVWGDGECECGVGG